MPYANDKAGVYRIVDTATGYCYVGQSKRLKKRIAEHFRLLGLGIHPNPHIQNAFNTSGAKAFRAEVEVYCEDPADMDALEEAFLNGEARFDESPNLFNISSTARTPMQGRRHTEASKAKISAAKQGRRDHVTEQYAKKLSAAHTARVLADPAYAAKVKFIVQNPHLSYAERGRRVGLDTSSARKLALRYASKQELLNG